MRSREFSIDREIVLLQELGQGNQYAFQMIYENYSPKLYNNLFKLTKDEDVAKELLQNLFIKIWDKRGDIDINKSFRSYLFKVAENMVIDYFRKTKRDQKLMDSLMQAATELSPDLEEIYISKENDERLSKAIAALPPQRQRVFILCKLEGKSYEEVSKMLGISTSTISDHIVKATKSIHNHFTSGELTVILIASAIVIGI